MKTNNIYIQVPMTWYDTLLTYTCVMGSVTIQNIRTVAPNYHGEPLLDCCVLNYFANHFLPWFLETLDFVGTRTARMPPEAPC